MDLVYTCFTKLEDSLEKTSKQQTVAYKAVRAIRDGEHKKLKDLLHWKCGGVKYRVRLKEPIDSDFLSELCIPEHLYKAPGDKDKKGATLLEIAAALNQTKCIEVLMDLDYQISYNPIVKS